MICAYNLYAGEETEDEKNYRLMREAKTDAEARAVYAKIVQRRKQKVVKKVRHRTTKNVNGKPRAVFSPISDAQKEFMKRHKVSPIKKPDNIIRIGETPPWVRKIGDQNNNGGNCGGAIRYRR